MSYRLKSGLRIGKSKKILRFTILYPLSGGVNPIFVYLNKRFGRPAWRVTQHGPKFIGPFKRSSTTGRAVVEVEV